MAAMMVKAYSRCELDIVNSLMKQVLVKCDIRCCSGTSPHVVYSVNVKVLKVVEKQCVPRKTQNRF